jgi:glycosyltransferase involved in cell wall biosynthesis
MGVICRRLKKAKPALELIFDVHNVVQKENGKLDRILTRFALKSADTYIMHGQVTIDEFKDFLPELEFKVTDSGLRSRDMATVIRLFHPVYDMFKPKDDFDLAKAKEDLGLKTHVFLFFGFIRKYKGLHNAIKAFSLIAKKYPETSLLIVGESFWDTVDKTKWTTKTKQFVFNTARALLLRKGDSEQDYRPLDLIKELQLEEQVVVVNSFVANEEVYKYFQVSDEVVNFYEYATPSGVESIAYNFRKPILATSVGHFKYAIQDGENGYLAEANNIESMAEAMEKAILNPVSPEKIKEIALKLSWKKYSEAILMD